VKFKYLGVVFTSDGRQDEELESGQAKLVQWCELCNVQLSWNENWRKKQRSLLSKQFLSPFSLMVKS